MEILKELHPQIGFYLLLNESIYLEVGTDKIALLGVENWETRFKKYRDLNLASFKINIGDFNILMRYDPSKLENELKEHINNCHLTLCGHTH